MKDATASRWFYVRLKIADALWDQGGYTVSPKRRCQAKARMMRSEGFHEEARGYLHWVGYSSDWRVV